jgi:hypothetical protein
MAKELGPAAGVVAEDMLANNIKIARQQRRQAALNPFRFPALQASVLGVVVQHMSSGVWALKIGPEPRPRVAGGGAA